MVASLEVCCYWPSSFSYYGRYFHVTFTFRFLQENECVVNTKSISISILVSWDSSHANREVRMRTMRTEPNFGCHDNYRLSPPLARHRYRPGIGLKTQMHQGPLRPKRASQGSNRNALPTIFRVGSTYVNNLFLILRKNQTVLNHNSSI